MVMPSLLLEWMLARAETFLNALLAHADNIDDLFAPLQEKRVCFVFKPMMIAITLEIRGPHITLTTNTQRPASLTLTGTPIQFIHTMTTHSVADLHMEGDGKLAQALQRTLQALHIDVEAFLESLVGGTLAHTITTGTQRARKAANTFVSHTQHDLADYCHYEIQATASQADCDRFAKDVNTLRYAVDHLTAKVNQLKRRLEAHHVQ